MIYHEKRGELFTLGALKLDVINLGIPEMEELSPVFLFEFLDPYSHSKLTLALKDPQSRIY